MQEDGRVGEASWGSRNGDWGLGQLVTPLNLPASAAPLFLPADLQYYSERGL